MVALLQPIKLQSTGNFKGKSTVCSDPLRVYLVSLSCSRVSYRMPCSMQLFMSPQTPFGCDSFLIFFLPTTLTVMRRTGQVLCTMSLIWNWSDVFIKRRQGDGFWGRGWSYQVFYIRMIDIHITIIGLIMNQGINNAQYYQDTKEEKNRRTTGLLSHEETVRHPNRDWCQSCDDRSHEEG